MRVLAPGGGSNPHHPLRGEHAFLLLLVGCGFRAGILPPDAALDGAIDSAPAAPDAAPEVADASVPVDAFVGVERRVNIEGSAYTGIDHPGVWSADLGVCSGVTKLSTTQSIRQTQDGVLFQSAAVAHHVHCRIGGLPDGTYDVTLLFAELTCCDPPVSRVFSISLEGTAMEPAFDLLAESGGCAVAGGTGHPVERTFSVAVTDGTLDVELMHGGGDDPLLSAVQAVQVTGAGTVAHPMR